jgi:hypothetical protein
MPLFRKIKISTTFFQFYLYAGWLIYTYIRYYYDLTIVSDYNTNTRFWCFFIVVVFAPVILYADAVPNVVVVAAAVVVLKFLFFFSCKKFMEPYWDFQSVKVIFSEVCFNRARSKYLTWIHHTNVMTTRCNTNKLYFNVISFCFFAVVLGCWKK